MGLEGIERDQDTHDGAASSCPIVVYCEYQTFALRNNALPRRSIRIKTFSPFFSPDDTFSKSFTDFTGCRLISRIDVTSHHPGLLCAAVRFDCRDHYALRSSP